MTGGVPKLREVYLAALEVEPEARVAFVEAACEGDRALADEVLALLGARRLPDQDLASMLGPGRESVEGKTFGRFTLLRPLGSGGMGRVDLAFDPKTDREVAIKRLHTTWGHGAELTARFEREMLAASKVHSLGLCPIYEVGDVRGVPYFVMPVIAGESLEAKLRAADGRPTTAEIREWVALFERAALAIDHAHEVGLVHRDLKPGNIMVQPDGSPVILDFGLVRDEESPDERLTRTGQLAGTPAYMAPEQLGGGIADRRTDVYALGVSLYESVCGVRPFEGASHADLFDQIRRRPLPPPRRQNRAVSRDLAAVLEVATHKDPRRRYVTARALAEDLGRIRRQQPVQAQRMPPWIRLWHWTARNPAAAASIAVLLVGLATVSILLRERRTLNRSLQARIDEEQQAIATAGVLREAAQKRLDDFDALAVPYASRRARRTAETLFPAWPENLPALQEWVDAFAESGARELRRVDAVIERIRARAEATLAAGGLQGEDVVQLRTRSAELERKVAALERTLRVRSDPDAPSRPVQLQELVPEDAPETADALFDYAWPWVDPDRPDAAYGREEMALGCAMRALELHGDGNGAPIRGLYTLLFALVAAGFDRGGPFSPDLAYWLTTAEASTKTPYLYATAIQRADQERRTTHDKLVDARAELRLVQERIEVPWLEGLTNGADRVLLYELRGGRQMLIEDLAPDGIVEQMLRRRDWAASIDGLTRAHPNAPASWEDAARAIARADGVTASERYAESGIELEPVLGLVPIGMNPVTGLWEFYHLRSAYDPLGDVDPAALPIPRHEADGSIEVGADTGIVFVLLPGGTVQTGSQSDDPAAPRYDTGHRSDESLSTTSLEPFFIARHELTQAQWMRLTLGPNPSAYAGDAPDRLDQLTVANPVESVSHALGLLVLRRFGLRLPGHAEWEYACRAGTDTPWSCGDNEADLEGYANVFGQELARRRTRGTAVAFEDGYFYHAPVGSFAPNGFGLYDVHGNVAELVDETTHSVENGRMVRGGHFAQNGEMARSAYRAQQDEGVGTPHAGLRVCRSLY